MAFKWTSQRLAGARGAGIGLSLLLVLVGTALLAPFISPYDPNDQDIAGRLASPFTDGHLLGTDALGRDILSRILYGSRISLIVGLTAVAVGGSIGVLLGLISGFYRGVADSVISAITNIFLAFPFILLVIATVAVLGPSLLNLILVLGVASWPVYTRVLRGHVLSIRERDYVQSARALGCSDRRILLKYILPNAAPPMIVITTFEFARMIILEASLSFLGLGVEPSVPSWGSMLADGRQYLSVAWWLATLPGLAIAFTVLGANLVGDWLRDRWDPRLINAAG